MKTFYQDLSQSSLELAWRALGVFVLYGGVIFASSLFTFEPTSTPLFWPANAIVLIIMLYAQAGQAWIYLGAAGLGYYAYLIFYDAFGFGPSFLLTLANVIEIAAGYLLIHYFATKPLHFERLKNAVELIAYGVLLNSVVGATAGTVLMSSVWEAPTLVNWSIWFGTAAIGNLMVLPLMIAWLSPTYKRRYTPRRILEIIVLFIFCTFASFLIFTAEPNHPYVYPYFVFPVLLVSALRYDMRVTAIAFQLFILISSIASAHGLGPFAMGEYYREIVLIRFHLFCAVTIITVIIVSALGTEREKLVDDLQEALSQIKTLSGFLPICAHCKKIRDDSGYWNQLEAYILEHSEAELSHGICPNCMETHYGKYYDKIKKRNGEDGGKTKV